MSEQSLFPFFKDLNKIPAQAVEIQVSEDGPSAFWAIEQPLLPLGSSTPIGRPVRDLWRYVECAFTWCVFGKYKFNQLDPQASICLRPLDNPQSGPFKKETTDLRDAYNALSDLWSDGDSVPLDWFAFAQLINTQLCGEEFLGQILKQYGEHRTITIVFADFIASGPEESDQCYILWQRVRTEEGVQMGFKILRNGFAVHQCPWRGEIYLAACVLPGAITPSGPAPKQPAQAQAAEPRQQDVSRLVAPLEGKVFDFAGFIKSGLATQEDYVREHQENAFIAIKA